MNARPLILILIVLTLLQAQCKREKPEYSEFTAKPEYIRKPSAADKTYYEAYDRVMELWNIPYKDLYIPVTRGTAHVIAAGLENSETVILLHGMNSASPMWYPNIERLAKNYRVFAVDLLNEPGKSRAAVKIDETQDIIAWYFKVFEQLKLDKFSIIGASRGGWLAVKLALHRPNKINRLVLLSPTQTLVWIKPSKALFSNILYEIKPTRKQFRKFIAQMSSNPANIPNDFINLLHLANQRSSFNTLLLEMQPFSDEQLQSLNMPVLLLIGDEDVLNSKKSISRAKQNIPYLQTKTIAGAGHFLSIDQSQRVNNEILNFLKPNLAEK